MGWGEKSSGSHNITQSSPPAWATFCLPWAGRYHKLCRDDAHCPLFSLRIFFRQATFWRIFLGLVDQYFFRPIEEDCQSNQNSSRNAPPIGKFLRLKRGFNDFVLLWITLNMNIWNTKAKMMSHPFLKMLI